MDKRLHLPLAVHIADRLDEIDATKETIDVEDEARRLVEEHPEAEATTDEVAEALITTEIESWPTLEEDAEKPVKP